MLSQDEFNDFLFKVFKFKIKFFNDNNSYGTKKNVFDWQKDGGLINNK